MIPSSSSHALTPSPRAGVAASVLASSGVDARPVLHGGVPDWDGDTVSFRRCGT